MRLGASSNANSPFFETTAAFENLVYIYSIAGSICKSFRMLTRITNDTGNLLG